MNYRDPQLQSSWVAPVLDDVAGFVWHPPHYAVASPDAFANIVRK